MNKPLLTEEEQERIRESALLVIASDCGKFSVIDAETTMQLFDIIDSLKAKIDHKQGMCWVCNGKGYIGEQYPRGCWNCSGIGRKS